MLKVVQPAVELDSDLNLGFLHSVLHLQSVGRARPSKERKPSTLQEGGKERLVLGHPELLGQARQGSMRSGLGL